AKLKKQVFGKSSEKIEREIQQLELAMIEPPECKNYFANAGYAAIKTWKPLNRKHRTDRSHLAKEYRSTRR
ncbi:hypothetical protein RFN30_31505, partial [Mesorhizobium sp. VK23D]|nr:hypothetical protein [Mesorhizobium sp. VK23D]